MVWKAARPHRRSAQSCSTKGPANRGWKTNWWRPVAAKATTTARKTARAVKTGTKTQIRTIHIGGGDASGHLGWVHVGLGTAERAEIRVQWPDGEWSYPYRVFANQFVVIDKAKTQAEYWYPGR